MGVNHKVCDVSVHLIKVISGCRGVGGRAGEGQGRRVVLREDWFWNRLAGGGRGGERLQGRGPGERPGKGTKKMPRKGTKKGNWTRMEAREGDNEATCGRCLGHPPSERTWDCCDSYLRPFDQ